MWSNQLMRALMGLLVLLISGCALLPHTGPSMDGAESAAEELRYAFVKLTAATVSPYQIVKAVDEPLVDALRPGRHALKLGPGDRLRIQLFEANSTQGLFGGSEGRGAGVFDGVLVDHKGNISLPYVGRVRAGRAFYRRTTTCDCIET